MPDVFLRNDFIFLLLLCQITCQSHNYFLVYACLSQVQNVHSAICAMPNLVELLKRIECYKRPQESQIAFGAESLNFLRLSDYQGVYKQIISGDESWIYAYDPETTDQSSEYRLKCEAKPKRPR